MNGWWWSNLVVWKGAFVAMAQGPLQETLRMFGCAQAKPIEWIACDHAEV